MEYYGIRVYTNFRTKTEYVAQKRHEKWTVMTPLGVRLASMPTLNDAEAFMRGDTLI